jgi:hypothetical protein
MRIRIHITVGYTLRAALMASSASMEQWSFTGGRDSSCTNMPSENYSEKKYFSTVRPVMSLTMPKWEIIDLLVFVDFT